MTLTETLSNKIFGALTLLADDFCVMWQLSTRSVPPVGLEEQRHILPLSWIPQNDVLGDLRTVVFVSHVGYGSLYEAAFHGIPVVCIPMFGDQDDNAARAVHGGWGVRLDKNKFTSEDLANAVRQVGQGDSPFRAKAKAISRLVQAKTGTDEILEWMECAVTYGIDHLVPFRTMKASYFAYYNLDAGVILSCIVFVAMYAVCTCGRQYVKRREQATGSGVQEKNE